MSNAFGDFIGGVADAVGQAAQGDLEGAAETAGETVSDAAEAAGEATSDAAQAVADGVNEALDTDDDGDVDLDDAPLNPEFSYKIGKVPYYAELSASADLDPRDGDIGVVFGDLSAQIGDQRITLARADAEADVDASDGEVGATAHYEYLQHAYDAEAHADVDASDGEVGLSGSGDHPRLGRLEGGVVLPTGKSDDPETGADPRPEPARVVDEAAEVARDLEDDGTDMRDIEAHRAERETREPVTATVETPDRRPDNREQAPPERAEGHRPSEAALSDAATDARAHARDLAEDLHDIGTDLGDAGIKAAHDAAEIGQDADVQAGPIDVAKVPGGPAGDIAVPFPRVDAAFDFAEDAGAIANDLADARDQAVDDTGDALGISDFDDPFDSDATFAALSDAATDARAHARDLAEDLEDIGTDLGDAGIKAAHDAAEIGQDADVQAGPIDVAKTPGGPAGDIPIPYPRVDAGVEFAEDANAIAHDLGDAGTQAVADTADAFGIADFDVNDPFGSGPVRADPVLNDDFMGSGGSDNPGPIDYDGLGDGFDADDDGDTDLDDFDEIIEDASDDVEEQAEDIVDDLVHAADSNDDGNIDEEDVEDAIEDATGIDIDLNPFD